MVKGNGRCAAGIDDLKAATGSVEMSRIEAGGGK